MIYHLIQRLKRLMKNATKYLYLILGIIIVSFITWNRLIRVRLPKDIPMTLSVEQYCIYVSFTLFFLWLALLKLYSILYKPNTSLFPSITNFYYDCLNAVDNIVSPIREKTIDKYRFRIIYLANKYKIIYLVFHMIPKLLVMVVFLFDVFYLHRISLFYKFLPLLCLPLLLRYVIYCYTNTFEQRSQYLNERLLISSFTTSVIM